MDAYTKELLALAVDSCGDALSLAIHRGSGNVTAMDDEGRMFRGRGPTLADAIAALLRDLGVEVPERPSEERQHFILSELADFVIGSPDNEVFPITRLRDFYRGEPLTVLALLEGDPS